MATVALIAYAVYGALAFGARSLLQKRRTGSTGFKGIGGRPGSAEWTAGVLFALAIAIGVAAPVLALAGTVPPIDALDTRGVHVAGIAIFALGLTATLAAQIAMGDSWRIGVDPAERTALVTGGPFRLARNPIFAGMLPTALGLALMVPSWVALAGVAALFAALELQVRVVEEPYLRRVHGPAYADYASRVGRFVPGIGKLAR
jgi:protein-S-isoprenylcysteine O-methyltransferase Ste14